MMTRLDRLCIIHITNNYISDAKPISLDSKHARSDLKTFCLHFAIHSVECSGTVLLCVWVRCCAEIGFVCVVWRRDGMGKCNVYVTVMECKMETDRQTDRYWCLCLVERKDGAVKLCVELVLRACACCVV
jgi:hypothetical protein